MEILAPFAHIDIPAIAQSYLLFRARLAPPYGYGAGDETSEIRLFGPAEIPTDEASGGSGGGWAHCPAHLHSPTPTFALSQIAFSAVSLALQFFCDDLAAGTHHVSARAGVAVVRVTGLVVGLGLGLGLGSGLGLGLGFGVWGWGCWGWG